MLAKRFLRNSGILVNVLVTFIKNGLSDYKLFIELCFGH